jgi:predicted TIM-barrel fold metal-dependent hydrolase
VIVDTHVHVIAPDQSRYPLHPAGVGSQWFREHPVSVEEYAAMSAAAGVDRAVLVQAFGAYTTHNEYVLDAAASDDRFVSVVIVEPGDVAALHDAATVPRCAGVRLFGVGGDAPTWFDGPDGIALWDTAAELDLRIVATLLTPELPRLRAMLTRRPDVPVVLDHCGFPDLRDGPPFSGLAPLFELAELASLYLKVTCHVLEAARDDAAAFVSVLAATFGAERLVWGSDYSQTHDRPYEELVELGRAACSGLAPRDQARVLGENALTLWPSLGGASASA